MKKMTTGKFKNLLIGLLLFLLFAGAGIFTSEGISNVASRVVIMALFAISFNLQFGYAGIASLGHALFFGAGGYITVLLVMKYQFSLIAAITVTILLTLLLALVLGIVSLKDMRSFSFLSMGITLAVSTVVSKWSLVGGDAGLTYRIAPAWMGDYRVLYVFILIACSLCCFCVYKITQSPYILMLKGVRENEERMRFLGVNTYRLRLSVYVLSSMLAVIAGILYAFRNNGAYTSSLSTTVSFQAVIMCVIGGMNTFLGPVLGAVIVTIIMNYLPNVTAYYEGILGVVVLLSVYFLRGGILDPNGWLAVKLKKMPPQTEGGHQNEQ